jgi:diguanylate cyclase
MSARPALLAWAVISAALAALHLRIGDPVLREVPWLLLVGGAVAAVVVGLRRHRPEVTAPWRVIAAALGLLLVSNVLLLPLGGGLAVRQVVADLLELAAFPLLGLAALLMIRRRTPDGDREGALDGAVVMVAMAAGLSETVFRADVIGAHGATTRLLLIVAPLVCGALASAAVRLVTVGREPAALLLAGAVGAGLVGQVLRALAVSGGSYERGGWQDLFIAAVYAAVGLAALHPSMRALTTPARRRSGQLTEGRLAVLGAALIAPPVTVLLRSGADPLQLVAFTVVGVLVLVRLRGVVGAREAAREELRWRAAHDDLTGLPNRREVLAHLGRVIGDERALSVLFIDLDGFKRVNDDHGHQVGDRLLVALVERLAARLRVEDVLGRLSGDEFVVVCRDITPAAAAELAERVVATVGAPFAVDDRILEIGASVGVTSHPAGQPVAPDGLLAEADAAMYVAKDAGGRRAVVWGAELGAHLDRRRRLERDLRGAAERGELALVYQPVVDLRRGGAITGVEALLRWQHPTLGAVPTDELIVVADAAGLIGPVGDWVLQEACAQLARWQRDGSAPTGLRMFVNFSPRQLADPDLPDRIVTVLASTGVALGDLVIELTETAMLDDQAGSLEVLRALEALGARLALDDFGTGFSSLTHLQRVPLHLVKVDAAFVNDVARSAVDRAIVGGVVDIARALGAEVVAEGIETPVQLDVVRALGCQLAQGYLLGRPLPPEEAGALLRASRPPVGV